MADNTSIEWSDTNPDGEGDPMNAGHNNTLWVLAKACAGDVYRDRLTGPFPTYRIHGVSSEFERTCCDAVYALEDTSLVARKGDQVIPTEEGKRTHAGQPYGCRACPQHVAQPARPPAPLFQSAAA